MRAVGLEELDFEPETAASYIQRVAAVTASEKQLPNFESTDHVDGKIDRPCCPRKIEHGKWTQNRNIADIQENL